MRKILMLASNPVSSTSIRLDTEVRDIQEGLQRARQRHDYKLVQRWAVRPRDCQRAVLEELPQIIHFSSTVDTDEGLCFENNKGNAQLVSAEALSNLFKLVSQKVRIECVVLNGCYAKVQADAMLAHVPYVIGLQAALDNHAAIEFAVGFYDALGNGDSVEFAFEAAKVAMQLTSMVTDKAAEPVLLKGNIPCNQASEMLEEPEKLDRSGEVQTIQNVNQQGKYNINISQAHGLTIGDG